MEKLLKRDTVRYIGVSNFSPHQLDTLVRHSKTKPAVHQFELHPYLQQTPWVEFHQAHGIDVTAYSPLAGTNPIYHSLFADLSSWLSNLDKTPPPLLENKVINAIAEKRGCTAAQVALAWGMARGTAVIPKSSHVSRIQENFWAQTCPLSVADMARIARIQERWVKRFNNPSKGWGVRLFDGLDGV
jgi:diketogulonate reductase-like aldo/keto reductase